jgi:hypothetical protein
VLLLGEWVALLSGRDDEFVATVLLGYAGMRWAELVGLGTGYVRDGGIRIEWQLYEPSKIGRSHFWVRASRRAGMVLPGRARLEQAGVVWLPSVCGGKPEGGRPASRSARVQGG